MTQSRKNSMLEAVANTAIGFALSMVLQMIISAAYGLNTTIAIDLQITVAFTVLSLARSYVIRRFFNRGEK